MVAALPAHIRLKLEQTLAQWRHWDCDPPLPGPPEVISVLGQGLSNYSVLVAAHRQFVVRLDGIDPAAHSLSRQGEWRSLATACRAGLAPRPRYFNPELASLVCDYLPPDEQQPAAIPDIADLLRRIHQLPSRHQRLDLGERLTVYEKRLAHRDSGLGRQLSSFGLPVRELLAAASRADPGRVLCHNDLLRANRLYSNGRLFALDWEYSAMGSPWYDLAVVAAGDGLDPDETDSLLDAYAGDRAGAAGRQLVGCYACVYRYLEILWYLAQGHPALDPAALRDRLDALEQALAGANAPTSG